MKKWGCDQFEKMRETRAGAEEKRRALAARLKGTVQQQVKLHAAEAVKAGRFSDIDITAALAFAATIPLHRFDTSFEGTVTLNRPTLDLLGHFLATLVDRRSAAVLQWPRGQRDTSILHPLAMLAMLGCRPATITNAHRWCPPVPDMRTLYFPWRGGGTGSEQRGWLVDRAKIIAPNALHRTRELVGQPEASNALGYLHATLGHLTRLKLRDAAMPHLAHPTLAELFPVFAADGGDGPLFGQARHELFGRVRHGAAIDELTDHRATLTDPQQAPFALFGIGARANLRAAFAAPALSTAKGGRPPDLCLIDLGPPGLNRLGPNWEDIVGTFLETLLTVCPALPVLAITHDGYVQRRLAHLFRRSKAARTANRGPLSAPAVLRRSADISSSDPELAPVSPITALFQSTAGATVAALAALAEAARTMPDAAAAAAIRRSAANLRRAAALPCGLQFAYDGLCVVDGQAAAEAFLEERSEASVLASVQGLLTTGITGSARAKLESAEAAIAKAYAQLDKDTPIGSMVAELASGYARKSDFSILVFANPIDLKLAQLRFAQDTDLAEGLRTRIARGLLKICHAGQLDQILSALEAGDKRNSWKRIALIAPPIAFLDSLLVRAWLPEQLLIICDRAFTGRIAGSYAPLSTHVDFAPSDIGGRMKELAAKARKEAEARAGGPINLVLQERPPIDVPDHLIDLTEDDDEPGETVLVTLESGRALRARPGAVMIRHERDAPVNPFDRTTARSLTRGDAIVVPDRAFVDDARRVLPVERIARSRVKLYHDTIVAALPTIAGATLAAKTRTVYEQLQARRIRATSIGAVQEWLNAETYRAQPPAQVRPHAPRVRGDFDALLAVLNIPAVLGDTMWDEGIEQLRSDRRRAGIRLAKAFISVLVDPHGVGADLDQGLRARIAALRTRALDHIDVVRQVEQEPRRD